MRHRLSSQELATDVLVVDGDLDTQELLCELLEEAGCHAECVVDGQHALEMLGRRAPPHLILLDLVTSVMDGVAFLQRVRQVPACLDIPVVVLSTSFQLAGALRVPRDVDAVLYKPVDLEELLGTVRRLCHLPSQGSEAAPL